MSSACPMCHTVSGTPALATVGPDLTHIGSRGTNWRLGRCPGRRDAACVGHERTLSQAGHAHAGATQLTGPELHELVAVPGGTPMKIRRARRRSVPSCAPPPSPSRWRRDSRAPRKPTVRLPKPNRGRAEPQESSPGQHAGTAARICPWPRISTSCSREAATAGEAGGLRVGAVAEWAAVVDWSGALCAVPVSTDDASAAWPEARRFAKAKAYTANAFSTDTAPLSTARLYKQDQL